MRLNRMAKYIDADELPNIYTATHQELVLALEEAPTAEVAEVRHGRWEHFGGDEWCCTACGHIITTEGSWERPWQKYCEECGAKMDEDDE